MSAGLLRRIEALEADQPQATTLDYIRLVPMRPERDADGNPLPPRMHEPITRARGCGGDFTRNDGEAEDAFLARARRVPGILMVS